MGVDFTSIWNTIDSFRTSGVQAERIALLKDQLEALAKRVVELEAENAKLQTENAKITEELSRHRVAAEFVEYRGALFRREEPGLYGKDPICPKCHALTAPPAIRRFGALYQCTDRTCGRRAAFGPGDLPSVIAERDAREKPSP